MSAQGTQGVVDALVGVGHGIPGADDGAQVVQLTQIQIAQIVSNAVSQALTHQIQQLGNSPPSVTAANHVTQNTTAAQQFQAPIKFHVPAFEGDSTASWLTWSQRVLYQARASSFENKLTAAVGDGLSVGADVFDSSNVDPVRLRNAHAACMTLINSCSGMALEIVQRSDAPNDAWINIEFHYYRTKGTGEILPHEINGKTMEPGSDPFKFMMEVDSLAADLHGLGDKSVTEVRKCVIIVSGLSADFEMECRILENNPAGLNRAEIERVVRNQHYRLLRQQRDSKALSASKGTVTENRGKRRTGNSTTSSMVTASIAERKVTALETAGARRKKVKNAELPTTGRRAVAAVDATSAGVRSTLRTGTVVCARALSTGCETVMSAELKRTQCWQN